MVKPGIKEPCDPTREKLDTPEKRRRAKRNAYLRRSTRRRHVIPSEGIHDGCTLDVRGDYDSMLS